MRILPDSVISKLGRHFDASATCLLLVDVSLGCSLLWLDIRPGGKLVFTRNGRVASGTVRYHCVLQQADVSPDG